MVRLWPWLSVVVGVTLPIRAISAVSVGAQASKSAKDGIYAPAQAERGKTAFEISCVGCHGPDLAGVTGPELAGERFMSRWDFQTVNQLYREIKTRMPRSNPATLTDDTYLDIVTYILQANALPPGRDELKADADVLTGILVRGKGAQAGDLPTGTLAQVVGCLMPASGDTWTLTNATTPVRTDSPDASKGAQRAAVETMALGSRTIQLLNVFGSLDANKGKRMEAKGFLVRDAAGDRLNVVTLEMVGAACGQ
jgi:mono/diheme cytochrome c family protein